MKLTAYHVCRFKRGDCLEDFDLFVSDRLAVRSDRRLHGQIGQDLEQMILDHVANGAGTIIEGASALYAEALGHGDLDTLHELAVPERLQKRIREPEEEHVVHRSLAKVMIDAEDRCFIEMLQENTV